MNDDDPDLKHAVASLRQQVTALASVSGVLLAAVRGGGLMRPDLETLLSAELVEAAAAQSGRARPDWELMTAAVLKVAAATARHIEPNS